MMRIIIYYGDTADAAFVFKAPLGTGKSIYGLGTDCGVNPQQIGQS